MRFPKTQWLQIEGGSWVAVGFLSLVVGCSGGPSRVKPPSIDASEAAEQAMEMFDANQDGYIAEAELDNAPALKASMATLDTDEDGKVSEEEIEARILAWQANATGITAIRCYVTMDGRPLEGVQVKFDPAPFLGGDIKAAVGTTGPDGSVMPIVPKADRPSEDTPPGIQLGFFRIRVTDPANSIPAKYNTETILGQQVAPDDPAVLKQRIDVELSRK